MRNVVGAGQTFYIGTHLDAAALEHEPAAALLLALAEQAGIARPVELLAAPPALDAHLLLAGAQRLVILTNNGPEPARAQVRLPGAAAVVAAELLRGGAVVVEPGGFAVEIAAWDGAAVLVE